MRFHNIEPDAFNLSAIIGHIRKPGPDHAVQNNGLSLTEPGTLIRVFLNKNEEKNNKLLFVCKKILNPGERSAIPR